MTQCGGAVWPAGAEPAKRYVAYRL